MFEIKAFEKDDIGRVIDFERELRKQEPDTYYWDPEEAYREHLERSFDDPRFNKYIPYPKGRIRDIRRSDFPILLRRRWL